MKLSDRRRLMEHIADGEIEFFGSGITGNTSM